MMRSIGILASVLLLSVACAGSDTVRRGDAAVWVSADGTNWSRIQHPALGGPGEQQMTSVTGFGDGLVAVGISRSHDEWEARVWLSAEGGEWTVITDPDLSGPGDRYMWSVIEAGPGLVAVGETSHQGDVDAAVWVSSDGLEWTMVIDPDLGGDGEQRIGTITVFEGSLIAGGSDRGSNAIWTSRDAVTWSPVIDLGGPEGHIGITGLTVGGPGVVAVGTDGSDAAVWVSADGANWSRVENPSVFGGDGGQGMASVIGAEHGLVAVGSVTAYERIYFLGRGAETTTDAAVWVSDDGLIWRRVDDAEGLESVGNQIMYSVTLWGSTLVAVGIDSADPRQGDVIEAAYASGQDVDGAVWLSDDGLSWTRIRTPVMGGDDWQDMLDVVVFEGGLVAVGGDDSGS